VLTNPSSSDIRRKDGSNVKYSEMIIGDDTKEAKVVAWDKQVSMLERFKVGERVRMYGIIARKSRESIDYNNNNASLDYELLVKPFTVIKRLG
jgi:ssDNA-binding replication factor A large subunit